jgi:N-acetylmuramoyl-L-alanine amidase
MQNEKKKYNKHYLAGSIFLLLVVFIIIPVLQYRYNFIAHMQVPGTIVIPMPPKPKPTKNAMQMQTFPFVTVTPTPTPTPKPACDTAGSGTGNAAGAGGKPVIVLDPGHSGTSGERIDPATGILDHDYPNVPEIQEMFDVAQKIKQKLEADGYTVIMTKNAVNDSVSHRGRADIANNAHAALAVSIHDDHGQSSSFAQVFAQRVGLYREYNGKKFAFSNSDVAAKSQQYAQAMVEGRSAGEGHSVTLTDNNFNGRAGLAAGNLALVQLFANVPWVYNEIGASGGLDTAKYAQGIAAGIEKAIPAKGAPQSGQASCPPGGAGAAGGGTASGLALEV